MTVPKGADLLKGRQTYLTVPKDEDLFRKTEASPGQFISTVFPRYKKSGKVRIILNPSDLNTFLRYEKFKIDSIYHFSDDNTRLLYGFNRSE